MDTENHIVAGVILVIILFPLYGFFALLALITGPIMDLDHIASIKPYLRKHKRININNLRIYMDRYMGPKVYHLCHTVELFVLLVLLTAAYHLLAPLLISYVIHIIMDINHNPTKKKLGLLGPRYLSVVEMIYDKMKKRKKG